MCSERPKAPNKKICEDCTVCGLCGSREGLMMNRELGWVKCVNCLSDEIPNAQTRLAEAGVPPNLLEVSIPKLQPKLAEMATGYLGKLGGPIGNLYLYGPSGPGKTWLAIAIIRELICLGKKARFVSVPWLAAEIRDNIDKPDFELTVFISSLIGNNDYLVLDDMGAQRPTEWAIESIYLLVDRWENYGGSGLIITSNLDLEEIGKIYSDRVASRIGRACRIVKMGGPDLRQR